MMVFSSSPVVCLAGTGEATILLLLLPNVYSFAGHTFFIRSSPDDDDISFHT